ncbi:hypothetical protein J19TS2_07470 [Cohnella xylanilytica]|uniref:ATP-binding protein n=1 Tax=Cohnella xylanilytica TaxID=557555 RepID=UPI001B0FCE0B|nr:ATP-binding protein [Cohnella xylanilytica]GIO11192.1 hypothetical protein J19TS2_07470 [Cohnella xylanilytica]
MLLRTVRMRRPRPALPALFLLALAVWTFGFPGPCSASSAYGSWQDDRDPALAFYESGWQVAWSDPARGPVSWQPFGGEEARRLDGYRGTLWLQRAVPELAWRDPHLFLRGMKRFEVYLDDRLLGGYNMDGSVRRADLGMVYHPFPLRPEDAGKTLTIRLEWNGDPLIDNWHLFGNRSRMMLMMASRDWPLLALAAVAFAAAVVAAGLYARRRSERIYCWFLLFAASVSAGAAAMLASLQLFFDPNAVYYWRDLLLPVAVGACAAFYGHALEQAYRNVYRAITGSLFAFAAAAWLAGLFRPSLYGAMMTVWQPYVLIPAFVAIGATLFRTYRLRRHPQTFWLLLGYGCLAFFSLIHVLLNTFYGEWMRLPLVRALVFFLSNYSLVAGVALFLACMAMVLYRRFAQVHVRMERFAAELAATNKQMARDDALKDEFLRNTSHELRTPLHGIAGLTESMLEDMPEAASDRAKETLTLIRDSTLRLLRLVGDITDLYRMKHSGIVLEPSAVHPSRVAGVVAKVLAPLAERKRLRLSIRIPEPCPPVWADPNRLEQILYNLVGNAIKYTQQGEISVEAAWDREFVTLSVADTGKGIAPERLELLFEPFLAAEGGEGSGTGLGLSIAKRLAELHGGTIGVRSEPGGGTVVFFTLPVSGQPQAEASEETIRHFSWTEEEAYLEPVLPLAPAPTAAGAEDGESQRGSAADGPQEPLLLIADDEPVNVQVLVRYLRRIPCRIVQAANGAEAVSLMENGLRPDLALLDIMMPEKTGYEVCQWIRERWNSSELPVILLSARNRISDLTEGFHAGANDYLPKPFTQRELLARVRIQLQLAKFHRSLEELVAIRTRELEEANRTLEASMREYAETLAEVSVLEERGRIANEMHDVVGHTLTAAIVQLEAARKMAEQDLPSSLKRFGIVEELVRKGLDGIRQSVRLLKNEGTAFDWQAALLELIAETERAADIRIRSRIEAVPPLSDTMGRVIYYALLEGLTNGIRHGKCSRFRFELFGDGGQLVFRLANDGLPFDGSKPGFGLSAMMERVHLLGGDIRIAPGEPGSDLDDGMRVGCRLELRLPLPA